MFQTGVKLGWTPLERRGQIFLEFQQIGQQVRVTAIDEATGTEVVVFGPLGTSQADFERLAVQKLKRRLERDTPTQLRPGRLV